MNPKPKHQKHAGKFFVLSLLLTLTGCVGQPAFGPTSGAIVSSATSTGTTTNAKEIKYHLINLSAASMPQQVASPPHKFPFFMTSQGYLSADERVQPGDVLSIRIWETVNDGGFDMNGRRETSFIMTVANSGSIEVPYAGRIKVSSRTVGEIRQLLLSKFDGQAIEPEINVQLKHSRNNSVSVIGEIGKQKSIQVPANGIPFIELLASLGGIQTPDWETSIWITRDDITVKILYTDVLEHIDNNILLLPGDIVRIEHEPREFAVYGAVGTPGKFTLLNRTPSLSDLLSKAHGLEDYLSEPKSVFIFRPSEQVNVGGEVGAAVYRVDFTLPEAFFLSDRFKLAPSDIVYVATAGASEFRKFMILTLSPLLGIANTADRLNRINR